MDDEHSSLLRRSLDVLLDLVPVRFRWIWTAAYVVVLVETGRDGWIADCRLDVSRRNSYVVQRNFKRSRGCCGEKGQEWAIEGNDCGKVTKRTHQ